MIQSSTLTHKSLWRCNCKKPLKTTTTLLTQKMLSNKWAFLEKIIQIHPN